MGSCLNQSLKITPAILMIGANVDATFGKHEHSLSAPAGTSSMPYSTLLVVLVILFIIATVPVWPYSRSWGFRPSGVLALVLVALGGYLVMG